VRRERSEIKLMSAPPLSALEAISGVTLIHARRPGGSCAVSALEAISGVTFVHARPRAGVSP
jgi:hypothetical protein